MQLVQAGIACTIDDDTDRYGTVLLLNDKLRTTPDREDDACDLQAGTKWAVNGKKKLRINF